MDLDIIKINDMTKTNHHFNDRDTINSYMGRCIHRIMQNGLERWKAHSICMQEFKSKYIKKNMN